MAARMQQRRGTAAEWAAANPTLAAGELGVIEDADQLKVGDGVTPWVDLPAYKPASAAAADRATNADSADDAKKLDGFDSSVAAEADTVPVRTPDGRIKTAVPTEDDDAVTKAYADSATAPATTVEVFTSSGTWSKPVGAKVVEVICIGAGGAGRNSSDNAGAGGGGRMRVLLPSGQLPSSVPVTVGAGGVTANTGGSSSIFGNYCGAHGGGVNGLSGAGGMPYNHPLGSSHVGNTALAVEGAGGYGVTGSHLAGGGGAHIASGGYVYAGGYSGHLSGGAAGSNTANGGAGKSRSGSGYGGSGGGSSWNGYGGAGGIPGGGGGGAAGSANVGPGGRGEVLVITYF